MSDIHHLIEMLKSDNPNKRYDACEELRVARQPLPQEAIDALDSATNDSNPDVADAAQRALALHTPQLTQDVLDEKEQDKTITNKKGGTMGTNQHGNFLGMPQTRLGWWAVGLSVPSVVLMLMMLSSPSSGFPPIFLITWGVEVVAGILTLVAIIWKRERSWLIWLICLPAMIPVIFLCYFGLLVSLGLFQIY